MNTHHRSGLQSYIVRVDIFLIKEYYYNFPYDPDKVMSDSSFNLML
jgi:hypothetical protein